jgi:hypothetical protein
VHGGGRTFFGFRAVDLRELEGHNSFLCLLLDDGSPPVFIPYSDFEEIFHIAQPASDGQYKAQLSPTDQPRELYLARQGHFNVEAYVGWHALEQGISPQSVQRVPDLSHSQVQTLLGSIGHKKGYQVRVPPNDLQKLDWALTSPFDLVEDLPVGYEEVAATLQEIDVLWVARGSNRIEGLFEVEHSTPIFSGLLRFNDVLLHAPESRRYSIVSNETRRAVFSRQLNRPTFRKSGLSELVSFLEYRNVFDWWKRLVEGGLSNGE